MSKSMLIILTILIVAVAAFVLISFAFRQKSTTTVIPTSTPVETTSPTESPSSTPITTVSPSSTPTQTSSVNIQNFAFNPASMTVKVGTTVTWTNNDSVPHTVTSDESGGPLNSQTIQPGDNFSFAFKNAGTFSYHCSIHPNMKAKVMVIQ